MHRTTRRQEQNTRTNCCIPRNLRQLGTVSEPRRDRRHCDHRNGSSASARHLQIHTRAAQGPDAGQDGRAREQIEVNLIALDRSGFHCFQLKGERCKFGDELALDFRDVFGTAHVGKHGPDDHLVSFESSCALIQRVNVRYAAYRPCSGLVPAFLLGCRIFPAPARPVGFIPCVPSTISRHRRVDS